MNTDIKVKLSETSKEYLQDIFESLEFDTDDKISEAVNYGLERMFLIEKILLRVGVKDPQDFIDGLNEGTVLIVNKKPA